MRHSPDAGTRSAERPYGFGGPANAVGEPSGNWSTPDPTERGRALRLRKIETDYLVRDAVVRPKLPAIVGKRPAFKGNSGHIFNLGFASLRSKSHNMPFFAVLFRAA